MPRFEHEWNPDTGYCRKIIYDIGVDYTYTDPVNDGFTWGTKARQVMRYFGVMEFFTPDHQENVICIFDYPFAYFCIGEKVIDPKVVVAERMKIIRDPLAFVAFQTEFREFLIRNSVSHAVGDEKTINIGPKTI